MRSVFAMGLLISLAIPDSVSAADFKVGVILPLSGALTEFGAAVKNGVDLAKESLPAQCPNVEFHYEDSQYDAKTTLSAYEKLRRFNRVNLIYNWGSSPSSALIPIAERDRFPLIVLDLNAQASRGKRYVIRFCNQGADYSHVLGDALDARGLKHLAVVKVENQYLNGLLDELKTSGTGGRSITILDVYDFNSQDFRSSITKLRAKNFDAIGVFLFSGQIARFYRQLQEQRVSLPSFGSDFFESATEIADSGSAMQGALYPHTDATADFRALYKSKFGNSTLR